MYILSTYSKFCQNKMVLYSFRVPSNKYAFLYVVVFLTIATKAFESTESNTVPPKLLILLLDGFRWDYYDIHKQFLPGFRQLLGDGVQVEYVEPIFPSLSLPSWTTIVTGVFPATHNILQNYMVLRANHDHPNLTFQFKDNSSRNEIWWQSVEPLWTTAAKQGRNVYMANFARCDVPYHGILPTECTGYDHSMDDSFDLRKHFSNAVDRFSKGYSLAMLYDGRIDVAGHEFGPNSDEVVAALMTVDLRLREFLQDLEKHELIDEVNIAITGDHGSTKVDEETVGVKLGDYVKDQSGIYKAIGCGTLMSIATTEGSTDAVYHELLKMPGVDVYKKKDIPEEFHFKKSPLVHDILVVARPKVYIIGLSGNNQIPEKCKEKSWEEMKADLHGSHGYHHLMEMRTILFTRGPAFKKGIVHPHIGLEDQYQIFMHVLGIPPNPHNGTWANVENMFSS